MKIAICYFSGTGNTAVTAEWLKDDLAKSGNDVTLFNMVDVVKGKVDFVPAKFDLLGFGCPVYAFNMAEMIDQLLVKLPATSGKKVFLFTTAADFGAINQGCFKLVKRNLTGKGYSVFHEKIYCLPGNMAAKMPAELEKQLFRATREKTGLMAAEIIGNKSRSYQPNLFSSLLSTVSRMEKWGAKWFGRYWQVTEKCNHCQKCVRECPVQNISTDGNKFSFGKKCIFCMRCVQSCPQRAITHSFGKFTFKGFPDGYDGKEVAADLEGADYLTANSKGSYAKLYKYVVHGDL